MTPARLTFAGPSRRLDRYLRDELAGGLGRRGIAALLRADAVRVNGRRAAKGTLLAPGDEITIDAALPSTLRPEAAALAMIYCDTELVAVDKAPGMPSTAGRNGGPSVAGALLDRFPEMSAIDAVRAGGLLHRLDTGTSGVLLAARTPETYGRVRAAFAAKRLVKEYLAVVRGRLASAGTIALPLARPPRSRKRMVVAPAGTGWSAVTEYRPLAATDELTLVHLRMRTGVTHQLRVHLAELGHPVLGDRRYGLRSPAPAATIDVDEAWHYLHALRIHDDDPADPALPCALAAPFPRHWRALATRLGWRPEPPAPW